MSTAIEWTETTWNPLAGCAKVSPGCKHCYAETMAKRLVGMGQAHYPEVVGADGRWSGRAKFIPERLAEPLKWRKPRRVFVNSMSDLFHEDVTFEEIAAVFGVMAVCPQHTFQVLTKRPERAVEFMRWLRERLEGWAPSHEATFCAHTAWKVSEPPNEVSYGPEQLDTPWPLPNVWLGVSAENQETADARIPILLQLPASVRFVSAEPLLGPIDFACGFEVLKGTLDLHREGDPLAATLLQQSFDEGLADGVRAIDWVIFGGESGSGARPCNVEWIEHGVWQCRAVGVPPFVKQLGSNAVAYAISRNDPNPEDPTVFTERVVLRDRKGGDPSEWPEDLRVREYPVEVKT